MEESLLDFPIHPKQHGFLANKSTESAISYTINYIEKHVFKNEKVLGLFLDISAAFDSIEPEHIKKQLILHGGDPDLVEWYYGYLVHRDIEINLQGESGHFSTSKGFPQGGVCSAKFWLIAFNPAIEIINKYGIEGNGYADDCSVLIGGKRMDKMICTMEKMSNELIAWGHTCGLKFNASKTVAMCFSRSRSLPIEKCHFDGERLDYSQTVTYLGVKLDQKLTWKPHIQGRIDKAKNYILNIANLTRKKFGPKPKLMRWAYTGIV